jgi:hypothetical protein
MSVSPPLAANMPGKSVQPLVRVLVSLDGIQQN